MTSIKRGLTAAMFAGLLITNVLTLASASFHDFLYAGLSRLPIGGLLSNSPTSKKRALAASNRRLNNKLTAFTHRSSATKARARTLSNRVVQRTLRNSARNIAQIPAESVPYFGVGLIFAGTALDLKDACDNVRDVDALLAALGVEESNSDSASVCALRLPDWATNGFDAD